MAKARTRLRRMQRQITDLRRQALDHSRTLVSVKRRLSGLRAGIQKAAGRTSAGRHQISPEAVRAVRDRLRMTREQFARLLDVSPGSIFGWETGRTRPRRRSLSRLLEVSRIGLRAAHARLESVGRAARGRQRRRR